MVPTHRSYVDFLMIAYVHYYFNVDLPFTLADEQLNEVAFAKFFCESVGGFFQNSQFTDNKLFQAVISGYFEGLINQNSLI